MFRIPRVSISMRELDRLKCIQGLIDKQLKQKAVAERLGLTVRQVRRLVERYELEGPRGLISKQITVGLWIPRKLRLPKI
jgi:hypothetical protein